jgi:hypothetical protein
MFLPVLALLIVFAGYAAPVSAAQRHTDTAAAYESWAALLGKGGEAARAEKMNSKATKLRNVSSTESTHLGFNPVQTSRNMQLNCGN